MERYNPQTVTPYSGPFGKSELLHLLRRTLFGVSTADLAYFEGKSLEQVVDILLNFDVVPGGQPIRAYSGRNLTTFDSGVPFGTSWVGIKPNPAEQSPEGARRGSYKQWWIQLMAQQERNLREKLVLFWHNHLVTDTNDTVGIAELAYRYNQLLRSSCIGNFRKLMFDITIEPAMLRYLNGEKNTSTAPDENYGREVQELFCIGKGPGSKYTEEDVKAAARVLTGWTINYGDKYQPVFRPARHDSKDKQFSAFYNNKKITGKSSATAGTEEIDEMLDMIFQNNETASFLARKLFTFFGYYEITSETESNLISPLAEVFRSSGYEIKPMLKAFFMSAWFFKTEYRGSMIKSPADFTIGMVRQLNFPWPTDPLAFEAQYYFAAQIYNAINGQGQELGDPPNVAGWPAYYQTPSFHELWIDTATYPPRLATVDSLVGRGLATNNNANNWTLVESRNKAFKVDPVAFVSGFSKPSDPNTLIDDLVKLFYGPPISDAVKKSLKVTYLLKGQESDYYWTTAYNSYVANPKDPGSDGLQVPKQLLDLMIYLFSAAEYHLH